MRIKLSDSKSVYFVFAEAVTLYYDKEHQVMYVRTSKGIQKYKYINQVTWNQIKNDKSTRDLVLYGSPFTIVTKIPRGLEQWTVEAEKVKMYHVNSSNIEYIGYDADNQQLYIQFLSNGSLYRYDNVDEAMWNTIWSVESVGSWFYWFMRNNDNTFPYTKLSGKYNLEYTDESLPNAEPHPDGYLNYLQ